MLNRNFRTAMLENLTKLGFTEKEAKVYLVLLRHGPALASTLACRTGLKRVSVYGVLDALHAKGLISFENTQNGRRYLPHDPECILYDLEQAKAELQIKWELARDCVRSLSQPAQMLDARRVLFLTKLQEIQKELPELFDTRQKLHGLLARTLRPLEEKFFNNFFSKPPFKKALFLAPDSLHEWTRPHTSSILNFHPHPFPAEEGHLLVQGPRVCFLRQRDELELMLIRDADYAKSVFQMLIEPYCKTSGVLAETSTISSLKG